MVSISASSRAGGGTLPMTRAGVGASFSKNRKTTSSRLRSAVACLCAVACLNLAGLAFVLCLEKFAVIHWGPAEDALTKFEDAVKELDTVVIEEQMGMKVMGMEQYASMQTVLEQNKRELETMHKWLADKEAALKQMETEKNNIHNMAEDYKKERDELQTKVSGMEGDVEGWKKEIGRVKGERDEAQKELTFVKTELEASKTKVGELQKQVEEANKKAAEAAAEQKKEQDDDRIVAEGEDEAKAVQ